METIVYLLLIYGLIKFSIWIARVFAKKSSQTSQSAKMYQTPRNIEMTKPKLQNGMNALFGFSRETCSYFCIGYYKDGIVYSEHMTEIGTYRNREGDSYDFFCENDQNPIGSIDYSVANGYSLVFEYENYPQGCNFVAEIWHTDSSHYISPKDEENYLSVTYSDEPIGAAAAYIILCYGLGSYSSCVKAYFTDKKQYI